MRSADSTFAPAPECPNPYLAHDEPVNGIADSCERSPLLRAADRTIVLKNPSDRILTDAGAYQSAVREQGWRTLAHAAPSSKCSERTSCSSCHAKPSTGQIMPPEIAREIASEGRRLVDMIEQGRARKASEFQRRAKASGVEDLWDAT